MISFNSVNNASLRGTHCNPIKNLTTDGTSSFSNERFSFARTFQAISATPQPAKKWIGNSGNNQSSTQFMEKRKTLSVGSSLNPTGKLYSNVKANDVNVIQDAKRRCRNAGACVPRKRLFSKVNAVTNTFAPRALQRTVNSSVARVEGKLAMFGKTVNQGVVPIFH